MKKILLIASGVALSLMLPPLVQAAEPGSVSMEPAAGKTAERFPEMHRALRALENAKRDLEHAAHDFGGHRAKALELTNQAIQEVKEGVEYRRKEEKGKK